MREIEERLIHVGVPYRVIGGPRFYERAEIRDAMAYLRCVVSPTDDLAFERIVNVPKRGLGDATIQILHNYARASQLSLLQAARVATAPVPLVRILLTASGNVGYVLFNDHYATAEAGFIGAVEARRNPPAPRSTRP